jgi:hypothetical protein
MVNLSDSLDSMRSDCDDELPQPKEHDTMFIDHIRSMIKNSTREFSHGITTIISTGSSIAVLLRRCINIAANVVAKF